MELVNCPRLWTKFLSTNGYRLDKCVGQGSFGDVYAVTSIDSGQPWAVKRLVARRDIEQDSYAMGEIAALASIQHPTIVRLHEVLLCPRLACLVMELAPAGNLEMMLLQARKLCGSVSSHTTPSGDCDDNVVPRTEFENENQTFYAQDDDGKDIVARSGYSQSREVLSENINLHKRAERAESPKSVTDNNNCDCSTSFPVEPSFLKSAFTQVTSALNFCHNMDLAHRDINPSNVLIFDKTLVKLADFGLCFRCREFNDDTNTGSVLKCSDYLGNDHYLAPEVRRRQPFYALPADVWSLGCLLYFMLMATHPPIDDADITERLSPDITDIVINVPETALREKCLRILSETCTAAVSARTTVGDVLNLWKT